MEKKIAFYTLAERGAEWHNTICRMFDENMSRYGVIYFYENSEDELKFRNECSKLNINVNKNTVLKCTGKDLLRRPYHYLTVTPDKAIYDLRKIMDFSNVCPGGGDVLCTMNLQQKNKVVIDINKSKKLDIMAVPYLHKPKIILISRKLKELLEVQGFSGYRIVPCLEKGKDFSVDELRLETITHRIQKESAYFQLVITEESRKPEIVEQITRVFSKCSTCNTVYGFHSAGTIYFEKGDLLDTDFQRTINYRTPNGQIIFFSGEAIIISSRVLKFLLDNKIRGLFRFMTDPPIKHGVVEVR